MQNRRGNRWVLLLIALLAFGSAGCSADRDGESLQEVSAQAEQEDPKNQEEAKEAADGDTGGAGADGSEGSAAADGEQQTGGTICVFVCGQVASPGVYELESGSRIYQAVEAAGGMLETASATWVNQAEVLTDGQQVYIPTTEEAESGKLAASAGASAEAGAKEASGGADGAETKVNLNTADREELMTLTGIGEAKAEAIIQYRTENGAFQSAEELMQVDGIKEGTFAKIKDNITV